MAGLLSTYRIPQPRGYAENRYLIEDRSPTSRDYFNIEFFPMVMGGGRHAIKLKGNGLNMRTKSEIDIEIIDSAGNNVFCEVANYRDRFNNYYISVDIYDITAPGPATAYFVGEAMFDLQGIPVPPGPPHEEDRYNVRWIKEFVILPNERNNADLIIDKPPKVSVAQISTPAKLKVSAVVTSYNYRTTQSAYNQLSIVTSNFEGYDRDFASSPDVLDPKIKAIRANPLGESMTENIVTTFVRDNDSDIQNGERLNQTSRFNTMLVSTSSFFRKEYLGGYFEFPNSASVPSVLTPPLQNYISTSGSIASGLKSYNSTIVQIVNDKQAVLSKPLTIVTRDNRPKSFGGKTSKHTFKSARGFSGSITYAPSEFNYVTSSTVNQTYAEFTFADINPISGQVYRIKTSARLGSQTGDYKQLNDQVIRPVEYLTDAAYSNGLNYARHESDYRLVGHFATQSIFEDYWAMFYDTEGVGFDVITGSVTFDTQIDSVRMIPIVTSSYDAFNDVTNKIVRSVVTTTQFNQNYNTDQTYTLSFDLTLGPYTELEVYMNSDPLNTYVIMPPVYPRAFLKSANLEKDYYSGGYNLFGKYLGKIVNDRSSNKSYGKVVFDFTTDGSGFGRPLFRARVIDRMYMTGSAWVGEVSIKPYTLQGFTPNLVQYAIPLPTELQTAATLTQSIDFKIDYFDYTGRHSEYVTYLDDVTLNLRTQIASNTCQDDISYFYYDGTFGANTTLRPPGQTYS
jgi:hypothetical protein